MRLARQWTALASLACGAGARLRGRGARGRIHADAGRSAARRGRARCVIRANLDSSQRRGTVRAAVRIEAPPDVVFQMMIRCADALQYVPHLRAVPGARPGARRQLAAGRTRDRLRLVCAAGQLGVPRRPGRRSQHRPSARSAATSRPTKASGSSSPPTDGATTLLLYRAYIDPPGFVPNWLARSTFKRELPQMLTDLRQRCEAEQTLRAAAQAPLPTDLSPLRLIAQFRRHSGKMPAPHECRHRPQVRTNPGGADQQRRAADHPGRPQGRREGVAARDARRAHRADAASARAGLGAHQRTHHHRLFRGADRAGLAHLPHLAGSCCSTCSTCTSSSTSTSATSCCGPPRCRRSSTATRAFPSRSSAGRTSAA